MFPAIQMKSMSCIFMMHLLPLGLAMRLIIYLIFAGNEIEKNEMLWFKFSFDLFSTDSQFQNFLKSWFCFKWLTD